jgi:hypothetical protein
MPAHNSTTRAIGRRSETVSPTASAVATGTSYCRGTHGRCGDALR